MGEMRNAYKILVEIPQGNRPLGKSKRTHKDNITMDLREIRWEDMDWMHPAQDRDRWRTPVNTVMNLCVS
jgi:hypothetical protein